MSLLAFSLIIVAALFHATWNFVAKKSGGAAVFAFATALVTMVLWTPITIFISYQFPQLNIATWTRMGWMMVALSAVIHSVYYVVLLHGYRVAPLSVVYPVARGTGPFLTFFAATVVFGERLTLLSTLGVVLLVFGTMLLAWTKNTSLADPSARRGVGWGIATGITISLYTLVDAYGVKTLGMNPLLFDYSANMIRTAILLPFALRGTTSIVETLRANKKGILTISILAPSSYILVLTAIQMAPVSRAAPAREISMLFAAFLGGKLLNEGYLARRMFAASLIAIGVLCLTI